MDVSKEQIQSLFSETIFTRGIHYKDKGLVTNLTYNDSNKSWYAQVVGSDIYVVHIKFHSGHLRHTCDCPAHKQYGSCKHVVATLLEIADKQKQVKRPVTDNVILGNNESTDISGRLIQIFSSMDEVPEHTHDSPMSKPMKIQYLCKPHGRGWKSPLLSIELKAGLDRLYVVKNINEFLDHVIQRKEYIFTKNFSYDPREHYFLPEDLEIVNLLTTINKSESFFKQQQRFFSSSNVQREMVIPPIFADQLFSKLHHRDCLFEYDYNQYDHLTYSESELPFTFTLDKQDDVYQLNLNLFNQVDYLDEYGYLIDRHHLYKLTSKQQRIMGEMGDALAEVETQFLSINRNQIHGFVSHVLPSIQSLGTLHIDEHVSNEIINPPFKCKVFLDQIDGAITARLEYHYDNIVIDPFHDTQEDHDSNRILMREVEKENLIMHIVEQADFKFNGQTLYLDDEEDIYHFLFHIIPELDKRAEVYMTTPVEQTMVADYQEPKIQVDYQNERNLLEVNFGLEGIDDTEISSILQSVVEKKRYYRLSNGAFVSLEDDGFASISELLSELQLQSNDISSGSLTLPSYRGLQIEELLAEKDGAKFNKAFRQLIEEIKHPSENEYDLPQALQASLREYQKVGFQWLKALSRYQFGGILADDMGLGKTLQSIAFLLSEWEADQVNRKPTLIISPASLVYNWKNEFEKFAPSLQVLVIHGSKIEREELLRDFEGIDVIITSYPLIRQDIEAYLPIEFSTVILDEAQAIKNQATKTAKAVKAIKTRRCFALSGTPIENSLDELWSIFDAILPGFFPNKRTFNQMQQTQISKMSRPFILRRLKKDVLKELPDKIESVHKSELTVEQKRLYLGYLEKIHGEAVEAIQTEGFQKSRMKILAGLTRLRQLCCHPALFIENYEGESGKLIQLLDMIVTALENNQRILIFSQFSSMLQIIRNQLFSSGKDAFFLDGQTPSKERVEMAERFNAGEKDIFLISLKAGGTGLNLTGADTVILYDLWWNPAVEEQAAGRAHRMGQKKVVQVFRLIANGTIEEKIYALQQKKRELIENIIQPGETMLSSLSEDEILELLSM